MAELGSASDDDGPSLDLGTRLRAAEPLSLAEYRDLVRPLPAVTEAQVWHFVR
jgi:hypothetical protein